MNLAFLVLLTAGLAARLRLRTPTLAMATLWFGMIGIATHLIVPFSHSYGVPALLDVAARKSRGSRSGVDGVRRRRRSRGCGWSRDALPRPVDADGGVGLVAGRELSRFLGWVAIIGGIASVLTLFAPDTPLTGLAGAMFVPALSLAIVFRIWAGLGLMRPSRTESRTAEAAAR